MICAEFKQVYEFVPKNKYQNIIAIKLHALNTVQLLAKSHTIKNFYSFILNI